MRIAEFDRREVLRSAMNAFISKGYYQTSMQDLKKATGLHPGSIYCAFENKRGLLLAALEHYATESRDEFEAHFSQAKTFLDGFRSYFDSIVEECEKDEIHDCLLQKALSELSRQDPEIEAVIRQMLDNWQEEIYQKLLQAQNAGEVAADRNCRTMSEFLVMGIFGLRSYSHTKPGPGVIRCLAGQVLDSLGLPG
jgi:AcrR family transcriptional regulator